MMDKNHTVKLTFSQKALEQLIWLKHSTNQETIAEVIRVGVGLHYFLIKKQTKGCKVIIKDNKGKYEELLLWS